MNRGDIISQMRCLRGSRHGSRTFGGPFQASLSMNNQCNLTCIHCYYYSPFIERQNIFEVRRRRGRGLELSDDEYQKYLQRENADVARTNALIDQLIAMGTRRFQFSGHGECFLHPNLLDFIARAKHSGCGCLVNTNGTLLDRTTIDELIEMKFDLLRVTTLAGTREMYLRTHRGISETTFDTLKENLRYLADKKSDRGVKLPRVTLIYIVLRQNYEGLFDFAEFADYVRADRILIHAVDDVQDPGLAHLVPTAEQAASVKNQLNRLKPYLKEKRIGHNIDAFLQVFGAKLDTGALYRVIPCYYGWFVVRVESNGQVYPCCRCYVPLGNAHEEEISDIWHGEAYLRFREEAVQLNTRRQPVRDCECNSCVHASANVRIYRLLHPVKGRTFRLKHLCSDKARKGEKRWPG